MWSHRRATETIARNQLKAIFCGGIVISNDYCLYVFCDPQIISAININKLKYAWQSKRGEFRNFRGDIRRWHHNYHLICFELRKFHDSKHVVRFESLASTGPSIAFPTCTHQNFRMTLNFYFHRCHFSHCQKAWCWCFEHFQRWIGLVFNFSPFIWRNSTRIEREIWQNMNFSISTQINVSAQFFNAISLPNVFYALLIE
jgi:hypothetical protein